MWVRGSSNIGPGGCCTVVLFGFLADQRCAVSFHVLDSSFVKYWFQSLATVLKNVPVGFSKSCLNVL